LPDLQVVLRTQRTRTDQVFAQGNSEGTPKASNEPA
jgi:hypothetical protein